MTEEQMLALPFGLFFTNAVPGVVLADVTGKILAANPAFVKLVGCRPMKMGGEDLAGFISADNLQDIKNLFDRRATYVPSCYEAKTRLIRKDGQTQGVLLGATLVNGNNGQPLCAMITLSDLSGSQLGMPRSKNTTVSSENAEEHYRQILNHIPYPMVFINSARHIEGINTQAEALFGYAAKELIDQPITLLLPELVWPLSADADEQAANQGHCQEKPWIALHAIHKDGRRLPLLLNLCPLHTSDRDLWVGMVQSLAGHEVAEDSPAYLTWYDPVTGLYNRALFQERLRHTIAKAERDAKKVGVLILNLDRFKRMNNSFGYQGGNQLLKDVGARIVAFVRKSDTVARTGSDQYAILLEGLDKAEYISMVAQKLIGAFAAPFLWQGEDIYLTASIGISAFPHNGIDSESLMKNSESAMHQAKKQGGNTFQFYTRELNAKAAERMKMDSDLHRALKRGEFVLHYQPMVNTTGEKVNCVEALVRWIHPENGLMPPLSFIPLLEETGLIVNVGDWILRSACEQIKALRASGYSNLRMAVNISGRQFSQKLFAQNLGEILQETGLDPQALELEITESVLIHDTEESWKILDAIAALGVSIALDDFGTGYSSLSYLKRFPIHTLKIDRNFVQGVPKKRDDVAIINAILALAENLGLRVVAEGVETEEQSAFLRERACHELQGYLFAKPMPVDELNHWLKTGRFDENP